MRQNKTEMKWKFKDKVLQEKGNIPKAHIENKLTIPWQNTKIDGKLKTEQQN